MLKSDLQILLDVTQCSANKALKSGFTYKCVRGGVWATTHQGISLPYSSGWSR